MPAAIDLWIRRERDSVTMRRDQVDSQGDIHVTANAEKAVELINFTTPADLVIWQALLMDLTEREHADDNASSLKLVQNGQTGPFLYVNGERGVEVLFTRQQLKSQPPQITASI
jgi:hypothetical protein